MGAWLSRGIREDFTEKVTPELELKVQRDLCVQRKGSETASWICGISILGSIPGSWRSLGEGTGNPLQYSCLKNSMARGAWWATVHGVAKSWTGPNDWTHTHTHTHTHRRNINYYSFTTPIHKLFSPPHPKQFSCFRSPFLFFAQI